MSRTNFIRYFSAARSAGKNSTAREKFDIEFAKIRSQALKIKKELSENRPKQSIYGYSGFLRIKEDEFRKFSVVIWQIMVYNRIEKLFLEMYITWL